MVAEVTNAWWKKARRREMSLADVEQAVTNLLALGIEWARVGATGSGLLRACLALEVDHSVYDCLHWARRVPLGPCWRPRTNGYGEQRSA